MLSNVSKHLTKKCVEELHHMCHAGGSFGSEWVQRWSADRMWEIRDSEEGHYLWRKSFFTSVHNYYDNLIMFTQLFFAISYAQLFAFFHWKQRHPDGVASVAFKEPDEADMCQAALDGRWFGGRKLSAQPWDGVTDYQVKYSACFKLWRILICYRVYFLDLIQEFAESREVGIAYKPNVGLLKQSLNSYLAVN